MDYEEKYKRAFDIAKEVYHDHRKDRYWRDWLTKLFPELKESEDERIVRCLLNYFSHVRYNGLDLKGTDIDEVIAWLEKQGDKDKLIRELGEYKVKYTQKVLQEDLNKIESQSQPKFKVGDKVTIEGDDTIYTIGSIDHESCWLTLEDSGVGWATFGVLKYYVE